MKGGKDGKVSNPAAVIELGNAVAEERGHTQSTLNLGSANAVVYLWDAREKANMKDIKVFTRYKAHVAAYWKYDARQLLDSQIPVGSAGPPQDTDRTPVLIADTHGGQEGEIIIIDVVEIDKWGYLLGHGGYRLLLGQSRACLSLWQRPSNRILEAETLKKSLRRCSIVTTNGEMTVAQGYLGQRSNLVSLQRLLIKKNHYNVTDYLT